MPNCVSLFSGGGGLDLGLEAVGFETVFATDIDDHSCASLEKNKETATIKGKPFLQSARIVCEDIKNLSGTQILRESNLKIGQLELLAGGPPCQAFSVFGRRKGREDPRSELAYHYLRIISETQPKAFVFENVYGLLTIEKGAIFSELIEKLRNPSPGLHYELSVHRVNAVDFGVPQFRDRVFIIGSVDGRRISQIEPRCSEKKDLISNLPRWRTVSDGLRDLPPIGTEHSCNHTGRKHSQRIVDRYDGMKFGERDHFTRINRFDPNRPSFTIIVGSDAGGGKGHIHPYEPREVTPRESARMQCFPDWWWFSGTSRHPIRQVGNAVPSLLAAAIGQEVMTEIFDQPRVNFFEVLKRLDQTHLFSAEELECLKEVDHHGTATHRPAPMLVAVSGH
jgi:DNA (cytosine-5)-methyltransferase 1